MRYNRRNLHRSSRIIKRMGGVHMSCLGSKHELLQVADHVIAHYYQRVPFVRNHPQAIDLDGYACDGTDGR